jgi:transcriptional regulator with PAS, ATPase and Fis domain
MQSHKSVLILKDSIYDYSELACVLEKIGCHVQTIGSDGDVFSLPVMDDFNLLIISDGNGLQEVISNILRAKRENPKIPILLVSPNNLKSFIIDGLKSGGQKFLKFPFGKKGIAERFKTGQNGSVSSLHGHSLSGDIHRTHSFIGKSRCMNEIKKRLRQIAKSDATVLITGETGTGKDLAGEFIHAKSKRYLNSYIAVNCAALPDGLIESEMLGYEKGAFTGADLMRKGKFELAEGGTLFLDEIGEMPLHLQAKLLHAIEKKKIYRIGGKQEIPFDVKIIAATNQNIEHAVKAGKFRTDLYYRLNVANVDLPPLRERREDLNLLIEHIIMKMNERYGLNVSGFPAKDMDLMYRYKWPGNIRELQNVIEKSFIEILDSNQHHLKLLPKSRLMMLAKDSSNSGERQLLVSTLLQNNWNKTITARKLGCSRMTVHRKIKQYNIVQNRTRKRE